MAYVHVLRLERTWPVEHCEKMFFSVGLDWLFSDSPRDRNSSYYPSICQYQPLTPHGYDDIITETMMTTHHQYTPIFIISFGRRYFVLTMIDRQQFDPDFYVLLVDSILLHSDNNRNYDHRHYLPPGE